jgi:putative phosphoesterase
MTEARVGVISDTHGLLRPEAIRALQGSDVIIHAGDIGRADVIERLREVAPTFVVRGNNDTGPWARVLSVSEVVEVGELSFYVLHEVSRLDLEPAAAGFAAVVSGHSHRPSIQFRDGILYLNPGSAGPRRFTLPVTVARVDVSGRRMRPEIVALELSSARGRGRA